MLETPSFGQSNPNRLAALSSCSDRLCLATLCLKANPNTVREVFNKWLCICSLYCLCLFISCSCLFSGIKDVYFWCSGNNCVKHPLVSDTLVPPTRFHAGFFNSQSSEPFSHSNRRDAKHSMKSTAPFQPSSFFWWAAIIRLQQPSIAAQMLRITLLTKK